MNIRKVISGRIKYLQKVMEEKQKALKNVPEGILKCNRRGKGWQYYVKNDSTGRNGKYIKKEQKALAIALGQKTYDQQVLLSAQKEFKLLVKLEQLYKNPTVEQVYESLPISFQEIVMPVEEPYPIFVQKWLATPYQKKGFSPNAPEYYFNNKERMRSKSELLIANMLFKNQIPFLYEKPIILKGYGTVYPDFTLLDPVTREEIYWEHMGMLDNEEYREHALAKIICYEQNDIFLGNRLILTFETAKQPLNTKYVARILQRRFS